MTRQRRPGDAPVQIGYSITERGEHKDIHVLLDEARATKAINQYDCCVTGALHPVEIMEIDLPGGARCGTERLGLQREGGQQKNGSSFDSKPYRRIELQEWLIDCYCASRLVYIEYKSLEEQSTSGYI
jgi:hypothetical protein